jgi:hypothetical protein
MKTCSVLKQRGCATRELYGSRRVDSRKRDKEQMRPFGTGTELCSEVELEKGRIGRALGDGCGRRAAAAGGLLLRCEVRPCSLTL